MTDCNDEMVKSNKLEYIRIRLYLMASLPDFEELVSNKVHLYLEGGFVGEISKRAGIPRKKVNNYYKIAKVRLRAIENEENADLYNELAESYALEFGINVNMLPQNAARFYDIINEYNL